MVDDDAISTSPTVGQSGAGRTRAGRPRLSTPLGSSTAVLHFICHIPVASESCVSLWLGLVFSLNERGLYSNADVPLLFNL